MLLDQKQSAGGVMPAGQAGAPPAAAPTLAGYVSIDPDQQHVVCIGPDGHVHELVYDGGWHHNDLTGQAG